MNITFLKISQIGRVGENLAAYGIHVVSPYGRKLQDGNHFRSADWVYFLVTPLLYVLEGKPIDMYLNVNKQVLEVGHHCMNTIV